METIDFIKALREIVIEDGVEHYKQIFTEAGDTSDPNPIWNNIFKIYKNLSVAEKQFFLLFIRLIEVDTASHILGIIDGSSYLSPDREDFKLLVESSGKQINGDLQAIFLEMEEEIEF